MSRRTLVWAGSPVSQCGMACQAMLVCSNVSLIDWLAMAIRSALRYMPAPPPGSCKSWQTRSSDGRESSIRLLLLAKRDVLTGRHLTSVHRVAVRQVQCCDLVVGQQPAASFEGGTRVFGVTRVEEAKGLVECGLRRTLRRPQRRRVVVVDLIHRHRSASVDHHDSLHPADAELVAL